jgi:surfeit locus 1 family protein
MKRGVAAAIVFGIAGVCVLVALGVWQLQRLTWKEAKIAELEQRMEAAPVAIPASPDRARDEFLRVRITGQVGAEAAHMLTSLKPYGPGYRVIVPVAEAVNGVGGRVVMTDLGYIPQAQKDRDFGVGQTVEVIGALYWPDETDGFTPKPDRTANIWFARDLDLMADALDAAPLMVVAEAHDLGEWPKARRLGINIPNDHLQYALTWFTLALVWGVMSAMLVRRERRRLGMS